MITTNQIHYIAGILEGEGYFGINKTPILKLSMTDKDIVVKIRDIIAPNRSISEREDSRLNNKNSFILNLCSIEAIQWMMTIYSLMGERRKKQIKEVLNYWNIHGLYKYRDDRCRWGHPFSIYGKDFRYDMRGSKVCVHCRKRGARGKMVA